MPEQPEQSNLERIPGEYTEDDLVKDMGEWIDSPAVSSPERKTELKSSSVLNQFASYQNNFHMMVRKVHRWINDDGSLNEDAVLKENSRAINNPLRRDDPRWPEYVALYERLIESFHSREIYSILKHLGYDPAEMAHLPSQLSDENLEMTKKVWIEMRKLGFSRMDLIG